MKFKAKPFEGITDEDLENWHIKKDERGYVRGYYVDGYLLGSVFEVDEEYINFNWWLKIDMDTLELDTENCDHNMESYIVQVGYEPNSIEQGGYCKRCGYDTHGEYHK